MGTWSDDRLVNICLGDSAMAKQFTCMADSRLRWVYAATRKRFGAAL